MKLVLNADLGEGEPEQRTLELMACIGAANIACGGHAGTRESMERVAEMAARRGVLIGAHPGMSGHFGRGPTPPDPDAFERLVHDQVSALQAVAPIHHVKLHGSLYHATEQSAALATLFCEVIRRHFPRTVVFALAGGRVERTGRSAGIEVWGELFADRGYEPDGALIPRGEPGALISDPLAIAKRVAAWNQARWIEARTVCVHADSPGSVAMARKVAETLRQ